MPEDLAPAPDAGNPAATSTPVTHVPAKTPAPAKADGSPPATGAVVEPKWRDDWRLAAADGDEKLAKRLERMQSPADVVKSWRALEAKMSSGEMIAKPGEKATDEERGAWRKAMGVPEKAEAYLEKLPGGLVIGEADKPIALGFAEALHGVDAPPAIVAAGIDWYYKHLEKVLSDQSAADKANRTAHEEELRAEWGNDYRGNVNSATAFMDTLPGEGETSFRALMENARTADGRRLGDIPAVMKAFVRLASDINPAGFIAPGTGMGQIDGVNAEIEKIEKVMRTDRKAYDKDDKMQARLRQLYEAQERLASK